MNYISKQIIDENKGLFVYNPDTKVYTRKDGKEYIVEINVPMPIKRSPDGMKD